MGLFGKHYTIHLMINVMTVQEVHVIRARVIMSTGSRKGVCVHSWVKLAMFFKCE